MKFLGEPRVNANLMALNFIYYEGERMQKDDVLYVVYKDCNLNKKFVEEIKHPQIKCYITKPEFRTYTHYRDWIDRSLTDEYIVSYKDRFYELSKVLKCRSDEVKYSPYVFGVDIPIENIYAAYFAKYYGDNDTKPISVGFFDIESDIIDFPEGEIAPIGEPPINALSYVDYDSKSVHGLFLRNSKNPQIESLENKKDAFIEKMKDEFKDTFPEYTYQLHFFDREIELILAALHIFKYYDNDYIMAWNLPYDLRSMILRVEYLGYDPKEVFWDKDNFSQQVCSFDYLDSITAHKRKEKIKIAIKPVFIDMLVLYAGIRSAGPKIPSLKLSAIAKKELKDDKYDYSEVATIRTLPYENYEMFVKYNIKDTLLLCGIHEVTNDISDLYARTAIDGLMSHEIFTSTAMLTNSVRNFINEQNYVMGVNRNKFKKDNIDNLGFILYDKKEEYEEVFDPTSMNDSYDDDDEDDSESKKKEKQFDGAFVSNPTRMNSTGFYINGRESQFIHEHVIDFDIISEYPNSMRIMNLSNETLVGKLFFHKDDRIQIPMNNLILQDQEVADYKLTPENYFTELIAERAIEEIGSTFLNLPTIDDVISECEKELE